MSEPARLLHRSIDEYVTFYGDELSPRELFALGQTLSILEEGNQ